MFRLQSAIRDHAPPLILVGGSVVHSVFAVALAVGQEESPAGDRRTQTRRAETADAEVRLYDGLTVEAWQARIKTLDFQSPTAAHAVPGLLQLVEDADLPWFSRRQAALTLGRIGKPAEAAVPVLTSLLNAPEHPWEAQTPAWAAKALALMGPVAAPAAPQLARMLAVSERSQLDRLSAVEALARIGGAHDEAVAALIQIASPRGNESRDAETLQLAGLDGLALVGPAAAPALPTLLELLYSDSHQVRTKAAAALGAIGGSAGPAAESLMEIILFDEWRGAREAAGGALATMGPIGEAALRKLIGDEDPQVRRLAAQMLGRVRASAPVTASLQSALEDSAADVRMTAAESLWALSRNAEAVLPPLLDLLTLEDRPLRIRAVNLLRSIGPGAESAIPTLQQLATDERSFVRQAALRVLQDLDGADSP